MTEDVSELVLKCLLFSTHDVPDLLEKSSNSLASVPVALIKLVLPSFVLLKRVLDTLAILRNPLHLAFPLLLDNLEGLS